MNSDKKYDVFLFYHPADLKVVEYLAQKLFAVGISLFFDQWHLIAGSNRQESLEKALDASRSVAVFLGPNGAAWEDKELSTMIGQRVKAKTLHPILVVLPGARKPISGGFVLFRESVDDSEAFEQLVSRIRAVLPAQEPEQQKDSNDHTLEEEVQMFPAETEQLIENLKTTRFVAVLGRSDSPKSSIVLDGLLPALQQGVLPDSQNWPEPIIFTPTAHPLQELAKHLVALLSKGSVKDISQINQFQKALKTHQAQLHLSVRLAFRNAPRTHRLILVVDQFEEVFTLCQDAHIREQFLSSLLYASSIEGGRVIVLLMMQDDLVPICIEERLSPSYTSIALMDAIRFKQVFEKIGKFQPVIPNPYVVGLPIDPNAGTPFVGRQDIIHWVEKSLQRAQKPILVLYGQRRMGKTSVLRQIEKGMQGKRLREELDSPIYPVYIDLQGFTDLDIDVFLFSIAQKILNTIRNHGLICSDMAKEQFSPEPYNAFKRFLDDVESTIDNGLLLLMLDEFEELENRDKQIFGDFRTLLQNRESMVFLLAGGHQLKEINDNELITNFNNILEQEVTFLSDSEATKLIHDPVCSIVTYDKKAVDKILQATGGHPYFIQFLCREIINHMNKRAESNHVSLADVNEATKKIVEQRGQQLDYLWDESDSIDQAVLLTMAELLHSKNLDTTFDQIVGYLSRAGTSFSNTDIAQAIDRLIARRMIKKSASNEAIQVFYSYSFDLLRQWILYKHRLHTVGGSTLVLSDELHY